MTLHTGSQWWGLPLLAGPPLHGARDPPFQRLSQYHRVVEGVGWARCRLGFSFINSSYPEIKMMEKLHRMIAQRPLPHSVLHQQPPDHHCMETPKVIIVSKNWGEELGRRSLGGKCCAGVTLLTGQTERGHRIERHSVDPPP
ncbi:unnamed protein product [Arctogadus glacialis]